MIGVSSCSDCAQRNPQPCALTTSTMHLSAKGRMRSRLVTVTGISTRMRVLRRVVLGVRTSISDCARTENFGDGQASHPLLWQIGAGRDGDKGNPDENHGVQAGEFTAWHCGGPGRFRL